jgi:hypothetical protein
VEVNIHILLVNKGRPGEEIGAGPTANYGKERGKGDEWGNELASDGY